jgi:hypothetical protein
VVAAGHPQGLLRVSRPGELASRWVGPARMIRPTRVAGESPAAACEPRSHRQFPRHLPEQLPRGAFQAQLSRERRQGLPKRAPTGALDAVTGSGNRQDRQRVPRRGFRRGTHGHLHPAGWLPRRRLAERLLPDGLARQPRTAVPHAVGDQLAERGHRCLTVRARRPGTAAASAWATATRSGRPSMTRSRNRGSTPCISPSEAGGP